MPFFSEEAKKRSTWAKADAVRITTASVTDSEISGVILRENKREKISIKSFNSNILRWPVLLGANWAKENVNRAPKFKSETGAAELIKSFLVRPVQWIGKTLNHIRGVRSSWLARVW